ncbi:hypothetical protein DL546_003274 [Coniochaeta pulveracea]|uniref:Uncharacterized protein n=1 Tax=Coniochaeta pulveracea TaxID=177199 RepID=A0A420XYQ8_9PEZI|nr:hypothetical protein DL546_003274 [Coniochaeta pulveracea]
MSTCYCANYYGSVHCRNMVTRFGERCKLCVALKSGASLSDRLLPEELRWLDDPQAVYTLGSSSAGSYRTANSTNGRATRMPIQQR